MELTSALYVAALAVTHASAASALCLSSVASISRNTARTATCPIASIAIAIAASGRATRVATACGRFIGSLSRVVGLAPSEINVTGGGRRYTVFIGDG